MQKQKQNKKDPKTRTEVKKRIKNKNKSKKGIDHNLQIFGSDGNTHPRNLPPRSIETNQEKSDHQKKRIKEKQKCYVIEIMQLLLGCRIAVKEIFFSIKGHSELFKKLLK
jgi:hypothetical protein